MALNIQWIGAHPNNYSGRRTIPIDHVTIHHAAGTSLEGVDTTFNNPGRIASATYAVKDDRIHQYLDEAWCPYSDGDWESNNSTVSIEMVNSVYGPPWAVSQLTMETTARLVHEILARHGLGAARWTGNLNNDSIYMHRQVSATACPGDMMVGEITSGRFIDLINRGGAPLPKPPKPPEPIDPKGGKVERISGSTRYATNAEVLKNYDTILADARAGGCVILCSGDGLADALNAGMFAGAGARLLLTAPANADAAKASIATAGLKGKVKKLYIFGSETVVNGAVVNAISAALGL